MNETRKELILKNFSQGTGDWKTFWTTVDLPENFMGSEHNLWFNWKGLLFEVSFRPDDGWELMKDFGEYYEENELANLQNIEKWRIFHRPSLISNYGGDLPYFVADNVSNKKEAEENFWRAEDYQTNWEYILLGVRVLLEVKEDLRLELVHLYLGGLASDSEASYFREEIQSLAGDTLFEAVEVLKKIPDLIKALPAMEDS